MRIDSVFLPTARLARIIHEGLPAMARRWEPQ
jgi:hypothetical protein